VSIAFIHNGFAQHLNCVRDYGEFLDRVVYFPDLAADDVLQSAATVIACRSDNDLIAKHADLFRDYLDGGGFLIAMGGVRADIVDPRIAFVETPTNFQWFMQPDPDSGHRVRSAGHALHRHLSIRDMQWHRHGHYIAPDTADSLVELCKPHSEERVGDILFDDRRGFRGRLMATTLDPHLHHGGYYIPPATRFLNGFYPWLRSEIDGHTPEALAGDRIPAQ
jgi:hypothetical protein